MALPNTPSFKAGGTINVGRCVMIHASQDNAVVQTTAITDKVIGISKRSMRDTPGLTGSDNTVAANAGDSVEVYGPGAVAPAIAGAAIVRGSWVGPEGAATGRVITAAGATSRVVGMALESANAAGEEIQVLVNPFTATIP
jgi:hypothetical protein